MFRNGSFSIEIDLDFVFEDSADSSLGDSPEHRLHFVSKIVSLEVE